MEFEDELSRLFDSATATLRPPIDEIVAQSSVQGRRLRRRRRNTRVAVGALGVTAIVCGTAVGFMHGYSPVRSTAVATGTDAATSPSPAGPTGAVASSTGSERSSASPSTTPDQASTTPSTKASGGSVTDYELLKSLLPVGANLIPMPYDWGGIVSGEADAVYNDGHGAAEISISRMASPATPGFTCSDWSGGQNEGQRPAGATPVSCATVHLTNGDTRTTVVTGVDGNGFYDYEVTLTRTDGTTVMAVAANGVPEGADVVVTRAVPPLTIAQLQAFAANPGWHVS